MTRLVHISDLHFGRDREELLDPLVDFVNGIGADLVLISGDLTQRARPAQFREARAFIDRLEPKVLAVPGNHDTPLENLFIRLFSPWRRWKRHIDRVLEPRAQIDGVAVAGLNTADPRAWQRGRLRAKSLRRVSRFLGAAEDSGRVGVVMMHHPPEQEADVKKRPMKGAHSGLDHLNDLGADLVLSGHLHLWRAAPHTAFGGILLVQAGTGLSTRMRGQPNDLNVIDIEADRITVHRHAAREGDSAFSPLSSHCFERRGGVWQAASAAAQ